MIAQLKNNNLVQQLVADQKATDEGIREVDPDPRRKEYLEQFVLALKSRRPVLLVRRYNNDKQAEGKRDQECDFIRLVSSDAPAW